MIWVIDSFYLYTFIASRSFWFDNKFRIIHEKFIVLCALVDPEQPVSVPDMHFWPIDRLEREGWEAIFKRFNNFESGVSLVLCIVLHNIIKIHFVVSVSEHFIGLIGVCKLIA